MKTTISLFDYTGTMLKPWADTGFHCVIVDMQHDSGEFTEGNITRIGADIIDWVPPRWLVKSDVQFVSAFPPCDHLSVSGARWFKGKGLGALAQSIQLFERAAFWCEYFQAPYIIENPVSTISSYWRKSDHTFHPSDYTGFFSGDNYKKKTCLWTGGGFRMPEEFRLETDDPPDDRIHKAPPSKDRKNFRSATPLGFARAVYLANCREREAA